MNSAGILMYHRSGEEIEVLLVRLGGPVWRKRDLGAWSLPKGEMEVGESPETTARREFKEELGVEASAPLQPLAEVRQRGGKKVQGYALEGDLDAGSVRSNEVAIEWPPQSGLTMHFPEIDRAEWFSLPIARKKILASQLPFLDRLEMLLKESSNCQDGKG